MISSPQSPKWLVVLKLGNFPSVQPRNLFGIVSNTRIVPPGIVPVNIYVWVSLPLMPYITVVGAVR